MALKKEISPGRRFGGVKIRAFISADILPRPSLIAALDELRKSGADLKVVKPELLHITLKFLGDTEEALVDRIFQEMRESTRDIRPFTIKLVGMGAFPSMSNIRVVWVGIEDGKLLEQIASRLDESLMGLGFERDRKGFVPHLTLARARSARGIASVQEMLRRNATTEYGEYLVDKVLLKRSVLSPSGPTYSVVRECAL